jgi:malic enzyme
MVCLWYILSLLSKGLQGTGHDEIDRYHQLCQAHCTHGSIHYEGMTLSVWPFGSSTYLSCTQGAFSRDVVELMGALNPRPIIFPLSNPVRLCEVDFQDAIEWTQGRVLFASGSPYADVVYNGKRYECRQGNNMYIFPGELMLHLSTTHLLLLYLT